MRDKQPTDESAWEDEEEEKDDDWGDPSDEDPESVPSKRFWSLGMIVLWIVMIVLAILVALPLFFGSSAPAAPRTAAISNAKQVGLALLEFEQEYGKFPDEATLQDVKDSTGTDLDLSGHSANAMFRQLIAYGVHSEEIFYCLHPQTHRPDNRIGPGEALAPGEVGFSYVAGLNSKMDPPLPLLAAPMKWGTTEFHGRPFGGKAVILRVDNSAKALALKGGEVAPSTEEGEKLFDPSNGLWPEGHVIDLRHPEP